MLATDATIQLLFRTMPDFTAEMRLLIEAGTRKLDQ